MVIDRLWDRLEPGTRQWFLNNPGCIILPRSVGAAISKATGVQLEQDRHGESIVSPADRAFIRTTAQGHQGGPVPR